MKDSKEERDVEKRDKHKDRDDASEFKVNDSGGDLSMSVEESNRLREKLGLKPLKEGKEDKKPSQQEKQIEAAREDAKKKASEKESKAQSEKAARAKEEKALKKKLASVKTLGDSDDEDEGGAAAWVNKSRDKERQRKEQERLKAEQMAKKLLEQDDDFEDSEEDDETYNSKHLQGLKVRHGASELMEGECVELVLADTHILNADGTDVVDEVEELENVGLMEQKKRDKARNQGKKEKGKPFVTSFDDVEKKAVLSKYDEEEADEAMELDGFGEAVDEKSRKQNEIRAKLQATQMNLESSGPKKIADEYFTQEEMTAFNKPKKKKKKKVLRKKEQSELLSHLEATAPGAKSGSDLGSREAKEAERAAAKDKAKDKREKAYAFALEKARESSQVLREDPGAEEQDQWGEEDEAAELYQSLARARRAAEERKATTNVAAQVVARREDEDKNKMEEDTPNDSLILTDTQEFCRAITLAEKEHAGKEEKKWKKELKESKEESKEKMDFEMEDAEEGEDDGDKEEGEEEEKDAEGTGTNQEETALQGEATVGRGLASTLQLLKDTGAITQHVTVSGRTNDKKRGKLQHAWDESDIPKDKDWKFNFKLEREDAWGRVMTPKEAFREFSWKFHGKKPGKAKLEKMMKQAQEEAKMKGMAAGDTPLNSMARVREATKSQNSPYIVLSGNIHAGQTRDSVSGYATEDKDASSYDAAPNVSIVAGDQTPMLGDKKVEFMLGLSKPPAALEGGGKRKVEGMLPPPAKKSKNAE